MSGPIFPLHELPQHQAIKIAPKPFPWQKARVAPEPKLPLTQLPPPQINTWYDAINYGSMQELQKFVTPENVNTYLPSSGSQEYTPVLYLARISPRIVAKDMLSYLLELGADLSLLAKTEDCMMRGRCTTIGNLASWRWATGPGKTDVMYDSLVDINNGTYIDKLNPKGQAAALKWKKGWQPCVSTGLGGKWKEGCGVPGISYVSSLRRTARNSAMGTGYVVGTVVGQTAKATGYVAGTLLTSPYFLVAAILRGGKTKRVRNSKKRNTLRNNRK
jgi:hypothetical protein